MPDILLVEDKDSLRQVLRLTLEAKGYTVTESADARSAAAEIARGVLHDGDDPSVPRGRQAHAAEGIERMRVESCGYEDRVGPKIVERGPDSRLIHGLVLRVACAGS